MTDQVTIYNETSVHIPRMGVPGRTPIRCVIRENGGECPFCRHIDTAARALGLRFLLGIGPMYKDPYVQY